jgi:hypothetical protein
LQSELIQKVRTTDGTPVLSPAFETSVAGLHMIGLASANCFGPAQRFAVGAKFTSRHLATYLRRRSVVARQLERFLGGLRDRSVGNPAAAKYAEIPNVVE